MIDPFFVWFYVLPILGLVTPVVFFIFFLWFWFKYLHKTARKLNSFIRKKRPMAAIAYDTGKTVLESLVERRGEGVVKAKSGYKILPRIPPKSNLEEKDDALTKLYKDLVVKKTFLEGTNLPFFVGYSGKIPLLTPDILALAEVAETTAQKSPTQTNEDEKTADAEKTQKKNLLLLDPRKIKDLISGSFSESQVLAIVRDTEEIMRAERGPSKFIFPIMTFVIIMFVIAIALKVLGLV